MAIKTVSMYVYQICLALVYLLCFQLILGHDVSKCASLRWQIGRLSAYSNNTDVVTTPERSQQTSSI